MGDGVVIRDFSAGVRTEMDATLIPDSACAEGANVLVETGQLQMRPGRVRHSDAPADGVTAGCRALAEYNYDDDDPLAARDTRLVGVFGAQPYATDTADQQFSSFVKLDTTVDAITRPRMAQFKDRLYLVDGVGKVKRWAPPGTAVKEIEDFAAPLKVPEIEKTTTGSSYGAIDNIVGGQWVGTNAMASYTPLLSHETTYSKFRPHHSAFAVENAYDGFQARDSVDAGLLPAPYTKISILEAWANDPYPPSSWSGYGIFRQQFADVLGSDWSAATKIMITFAVNYGTINAGGSLKIYAMFGKDDVSGATLQHSRLLADSTAATLPASGTWVMAREISLADIAAEDRNQVRWLGFKIVVDDVDTVIRPDNSHGHHIFATTDYGIALMVADIAIDVAVASEGTIPVGKYEFATLYVDADDHTRTSPLSELPHDPATVNPLLYPYIQLPQADAVAIKLTYYQDADVNCSAIRLFVRCEITGGEWRCIKEDLTDAMSTGAVQFECSWNGAVDDNAPFVDQYITAPPAGLALLCEHKGRMWYAGGDTLYSSHWDDAERVPLEVLPDMSQNYGFFTPVGNDGQAITGLLSFGNVLVITKRRGFYLLAGDDTTNFALKKLSGERGCVVQETLCDVEGNLVAWLEADGRVWGWDGKTFSNLGKPVDRLLQATVEAQRQAAFAYYDPAHRWYVLTLPEDPAGEGYPHDCAATSYVFALRAGSWQPVWTGQPGGCALYCTNTSTPGVYAGDRYGPAGSARLYRLHTGSTDADAATSAAKAIDWSWYSKAFSYPGPTIYKTVRRVIAWVTGIGSGIALTLHLRANGAGTDAASKAVTSDAAPEQPRQAQWMPQPIADMSAYQLGVSGSHSTPVEIRELDAEVITRGRVR
ncbi:MAG: hypothetical protein ACYDBB_24670 [Armatimonadota bacterium]